MAVEKHLSIVQPRKLSDSETIKIIENHITNPPLGSVVFEITPAVAARLLTFNDANRPRKPGKIAEYADDMTDAMWKVTGDTVKFSDKLRLRDGQNRLLACVRANRPFTTHIVFGIDDDAFPWMDQGKPRGGSDVFTIAGVKEAAKVAAIVRWLLLFENNRVKMRDSFRPAQLQDAYKQYDPGLMAQAVKVAGSIYGVDRSPTGAVGALFYLAHKQNPKLAEQFFQSWQTGHFSGRFKPLQKALKVINAIKAQSSGRMHDVVRAAILVIAWNLVLKNKSGSATSFNWQTSMDFPVLGA
ncbi:hypothetical protein [Bradyrhizobium sp. USDA 4350]